MSRFAALLVLGPGLLGGPSALAQSLDPPASPEEPVQPPPPVVTATPPYSLPDTVTPVQDSRPMRFIMEGGNVVVARRVGEDPEFFWVLRDGALARVRKSEVSSMDFRTDEGRAPQRLTFLEPAERLWVGVSVCAQAATGPIRCVTFDHRDTPAMADSSSAAISMGAGHACSIDASGALACWGDNAFAQVSVAPASSEIPPHGGL
jgi:hypothetical protein